MHQSSAIAAHHATTIGSASVLLDSSAATVDMDLLLLDSSRFIPDDFPIEDCDETARIQRALEIAEGVEPPPGFMSSLSSSSKQSPIVSSAVIHKTIAPKAAVNTCEVSPSTLAVAVAAASSASAAAAAFQKREANWRAFSSQLQMDIPNADDVPRIVIHSQVMRSLHLLYNVRQLISPQITCYRLTTFTVWYLI